MDALVGTDWRWIPCLSLLLLSAIAFASAAFQWANLRRAPHRNLAHMLAFRKAMIGLGLLGVGAGWWLQSPVPFWAGVVIGIEETIESSIALIGLRMEAAEEGNGYGPTTRAARFPSPAASRRIVDRVARLFSPYPCNSRS
jgi:hypothetical protein